MNHVLLSKYHRNENILIQALLPNPNLQPSCFSPIRALTASKEDRGESKGGSPGGIFYSKKPLVLGVVFPLLLTTTKREPLYQA